MEEGRGTHYVEAGRDNTLHAGGGGGAAVAGGDKKSM